MLAGRPVSSGNQRNTPLANTIKDPDSFADAFLLAAYATAATQRLGLAVSTDAIRRGPAELMQTMLTLASATDGRVALTLGAGELKQAKPFGYKRSEGLRRLEDHLKISRRLLECDEPFDFDGHHWAYRQAWIGAGKLRRPEIWTMGGGPKLAELSAKYADGWSTAIPNAFFTPDAFGKEVKRIKDLLERNGRDPDDFTFGIWATVMLHNDPEVLEHAMSNPLVKYMAAAFGRLNQADWEVEGIEPVYPRDWHYALKLLPAQESPEKVDAIVAQTPVEMCRRGWFWGNPKEVASSIQAYVDAGATWVSVGDMMPLLLPVEHAPASIDRQIETCRILKQG
ncbi:MAG: LLM class flavin-dependent oxidoreductase [Mycobacterium sp.]